MADKAVYTSSGGQFTCCLVANTAVNTIANSTAAVTATGAGRLCRVAVYGNTVNSIILYDNSTGPAGPILWQSTINSTIPVATMDLQLAFANGIWVSVATNGPGAAFGFALSGVGGAS